MQQKAGDAEKYFLEAIELSPNYTTTSLWYARFLNHYGRHEGGVLYLQKSIELDPLAPIIRTNLAETLSTADRADEAIWMLREGIVRAGPN